MAPPRRRLQQSSNSYAVCHRARGVGACVATFTVGGLSIINAIAGAYSEDLPVICITGREHCHFDGRLHRWGHAQCAVCDAVHQRAILGLPNSMTSVLMRG